MRDHISKYLKINEIITPSQHGFVPNRACMTNLLETLYAITNEVNLEFRDKHNVALCSANSSDGVNMWQNCF